MLKTEKLQYELKINNLSDQLDELERNRLLDMVTGIPNQEKLKLDIVKYATGPGEHRNFQFILIDLDNFGSINKKHGFLKGDEVIRLIAKNIYESTRRNEDMYKRTPIGLDQENPLVSRMYRSYTGGMNSYSY